MVFTDDDKGEVKFTTTKTDGQLEVSAEDFIKFAKEHENKDVSFSTSKEPDTFSTYFPLTLLTADVAEVVRCKDCKHSFGYTTGYGLYGGLTCEALDRDVDDDFFCAYGERRDD